MKINLHIHSNHSLDGSKTVKELMDTFKEFDLISITDHDTCEAYKEIKEDNIITGMEADAVVGNHTYDFLCYGFDLDGVYKYAKETYQTIEIRQTKIFNALVELCENKGIPLTDIDSYDPKKEYAHGALYRMLEENFLNKYNIKSVGDLYRLSTIDQTFPLYIDMHIVWPDIVELIDVIHNNNGKVFIAHPYRYNKPVEEVLEDVKNYVDGIEIYNYPKDKSEVEYLYNYALKHNLLISYGTDYHNEESDLTCNITPDMEKEILNWINTI